MIVPNAWKMINFCLSAKSIIFPRRMWKSAIPIFYMQEWEAIWRKKEYKIEDPEILSAILYHTTGRPGMTLLEQIIFTADYIEPGRKQAPNLTQIRHLAFTDLDAAVTKILEDTLEYLKSGDGEMDPMTEETYNYYKKNESIK